MIVGEPIYLICLVPVVTLFYLVRSGKARLVFLLAVSYGFYATYGVGLIALLAAITLAAFGSSLIIDRIVAPRTRLTALLFAILLCGAPLAFFKGIAPLLSAAPHTPGADWDFTLARSTLPVGLSFYTFIALGYVIDVYLGVVAPERNPLRVALFVGFFPQLTAGPISRAPRMLPQLDLAQRLRADMVMQGVQDILVGAAMKLVIADTLSAPVDAIYAAPQAASAGQLLFATTLFAFQLYADFAGYSLIAIGSGRLFGIELPPNFQQPYLSGSIQEFWRRWHMSLFFWLRDYVFTPLRMSWRKAPRLGMYAAILITLTLVGVWHGVGWGFCVFGIVHGLLMIGSMASSSWRQRAWAWLGAPAWLVATIRVPITFVMVMLTMVLLRAKDLGQALLIYRGIFSAKLLHGGAIALPLARAPVASPAIGHAAAHLYVFLVAVLVAGDMLAKSGVDLARKPAPIRAAVYSFCVLALAYQLVMSHGTRPFIYLQF